MNKLRCVGGPGSVGTAGALVVASLLVACGGAAEKTASPEKEAAQQPAPTTETSECIAKANPGTELPADAPTRISVRHIVVKHIDAHSAPDRVTRSRVEACARAEEALEKLKAGEDFGKVVADYSDENGAATRAGSLGEVKVDDVAPSFAAAAFALDIDQVSYIVESKFGFHIIQRTN